jgi:hypothetical protein
MCPSHPAVPRHDVGHASLHPDRLRVITALRLLGALLVLAGALGLLAGFVWTSARGSAAAVAGVVLGAACLAAAEVKGRRSRGVGPPGPGSAP